MIRRLLYRALLAAGLAVGSLSILTVLFAAPWTGAAPLQHFILACLSTAGGLLFLAYMAWLWAGDQP